MELRRKPSDLAAGGVAMQFAFAGRFVERGNRSAQFLLRGSGVGRCDRFGGHLDGCADLGPGCAVMFAALEVLPLALLC